MEITSSHTSPFDTAPHDVLVIICSYIDAGSVFKAARLVSHRLKRAADGAHPRGRVTFCNGLATLMMKFPAREWDILHLAYNNRVPRELFSEFDEFNASAGPDVSARWKEIIRGCYTGYGYFIDPVNDNDSDNDSMPWSGGDINSNVDDGRYFVDLDDPGVCEEELKGILTGLCYNNIHAPWAALMAARDINWNFRALAANFTITQEMLDDPRVMAYECEIIVNETATIPIVRANPHISWNWYKLTTITTLDEIFANPDLPWKFGQIEDPFVTLQRGYLYPGCRYSGPIDFDVLQHEGDWRLAHELSTRSLTWEDVAADPNKYNFALLSENRRL